MVGLTIGVSGNSYGTANFCWLSYSHSSIWGMLGPEIVCSAAHAILMMLNLKTVFAVKTEDMVTLKMVFFINAGVLPLVVGFHVTSLVMVNQVWSLTKSFTFAFCEIIVLTAIKSMTLMGRILFSSLPAISLARSWTKGFLS